MASEHEVESIALVYIRCICGWYHRLENLKGKTDEELSMEVLKEFHDHRSKKSRK